jgi:UDP:flavonoid glycosyltransferase YjiC (YdhE family)
VSRFLVIVPPFPSHIFPTVSVGRELVRRGHAVAWVTYGSQRGLLPDGAPFFPLASDLPGATVDAIRRRTGAPWLAGMKAFFEEVVVPMARDMLPGVGAALDAFRPDVVLADQMALAGPLAARQRGLPFATSSTSCALIADSFGPYPKVEDWVVGLYEGLQREAGLAPVRWPDRSPDLVLLYTSRRYAGPGMDFPEHYRFVGPALEGRAEDASDFPWEALGEGPKVLVSLGSLYAFRGERFFRVVAEALADAPLQVIVSAPEGAVPGPPPNFIVRPWVPVVGLLPRLDALVTHAGTTLTEGLLHGLPSVAAPIAQEQGVFAQKAVDAGAAVRVAFNRVTPAELRKAVFQVLEDPAYRAAAARLGASFREAGGAAAAAAALEGLGLGAAGATPAS